MRGESTPIPASRPAWVLNPPFWKIVTALLIRGAIRPSGLAVGRPGIVGTRGLLRRANRPPPLALRVGIRAPPTENRDALP
jgi:hypothetical protein